MDTMLYKLVDRRAVLCRDVAAWDEWFRTADRRVAETWIDDVRISTVFLGVDHNFFPGHDPALFETMVFADEEDFRMERYFIWEEAEAGHAEMVALIRSEMEQAQSQAAAAWKVVMERLSTEAPPPEG